MYVQGMNELDENAFQETDGPLRHIEENMTGCEFTMQCSHTKYEQSSSIEADNGLSETNTKFNLTPTLKISNSKSVDKKAVTNFRDAITTSSSFDGEESKLSKWCKKLRFFFRPSFDRNGNAEKLKNKHIASKSIEDWELRINLIYNYNSNKSIQTHTSKWTFV